MIRRLKGRSPYGGYIFVAIVISLVCNFSYLLLLVTSQSDTGNRRINVPRHKNRESAIVEGTLSVNGDGFGYIVTEEGDSVYVDHRKLHWLGLCEGDNLIVEAGERSSFEAEHLFMRRVIKRNGEEFDYGALYRGSEQWYIVIYQFVFYFILSIILLLIMNGKGGNSTWWQQFLRATACLLITTAAYFISPVPMMHSGEVAD